MMFEMFVMQDLNGNLTAIREQVVVQPTFSKFHLNRSFEESKGLRGSKVIAFQISFSQS